MDNNSFVKLATDSHVSLRSDGLSVFSESGIIEITSEQNKLVALSEKLLDGTTISELDDLLGPKNARGILHALLNKNLIVFDNTERNSFGQYSQVYSWLSSVTPFPSSALEMLSKKTVMLIGVGGIGSLVAEHLSASGIFNFILVDGDVVEISNLNRQFLFDHSSLGSFKVDVVSEKLRLRNPKSIIKKYRLFINEREDIRSLLTENFDLLVNCADQPKNLNDILFELCELQSSAYISSGVGIHKGYWGPLFTCDFYAKFHDLNNSIRKSQSELEATWEHEFICKSSYSPFNSTIASLVASDVIMFLSGIKQPKSYDSRIYCDFRNYKFISVSCSGNRTFENQGIENG